MEKIYILTVGSGVYDDYRETRVGLAHDVESLERKFAEWVEKHQDHPWSDDIYVEEIDVETLKTRDIEVRWNYHHLLKPQKKTRASIPDEVVRFYSDEMLKQAMRGTVWKNTDTAK